VSDETYELGMRIRRDVLGDEYVDRVSQVDDFSRDMQRLTGEYCWGWLWGREQHMSRKQRSINNLCILSALGRWEELELHLRGALRNGVTYVEIRETLLQVAVYAGVPAGVSAFRIARKVLADEGVAIPG
jgi:4-carboxymuconolactone decarboxylase